MSKNTKLTPDRVPISQGRKVTHAIRHKNLTPAPNSSGPASGPAAPESGTSSFTNTDYEARRNEELVREYAAALDAAWDGEPQPAPASDRKPLQSGIELTESQYAGIVQLLFEDRGVEDAFDQVVTNRALISSYRDAGAEPAELALHVLSRR